MRVSGGSRGAGGRPTDCRVAISIGLGVFGLFAFDPIHVRVLSLEDFLFPFLHPVEEYLQPQSIDGAALVEIPVWKTVKNSIQLTRYKLTHPRTGGPTCKSQKDAQARSR
jgi:hypothetical protein